VQSVRPPVINRAPGSYERLIFFDTTRAGLVANRGSPTQRLNAIAQTNRRKWARWRSKRDAALSGTGFDEETFARCLRRDSLAACASGGRKSTGRNVMNRDELEGKWDQAKGKVKENVGRAVNDRDMEAEGAGDQAKGNVQEGFGKVRRNIGEAVEDLGDKIRD